MARIDVIGLGPADEAYLTSETLALIAGAKYGFVRTRRHPSASVVSHFESFDDVYEDKSNIDDVYSEIVSRLLSAAKQFESVVYAVPGSPLVAERTVELLRDKSDVEIEIHPAMSFLDLCWQRLGIDPLSREVELADGHSFVQGDVFVTGSVLIAQCDSKEVLSSVKLSADADSIEVTVLQRLGLPDENVENVRWSDLDRVIDADHLTSLWIADFPVRVGASLAALNDVVLRLRNECPWDREQTHQTLAKHLLEEAYEAVEAINAFLSVGGYESDSAQRGKAIEHLIEELGDVFMQIFMHAAIATQEGEFTITDVADRIREKLIHRHPHVFGDFEATTPAEVEANWEKLKEKEGKQPKDSLTPAGSLPSLLFTSELRERMAKRGFEYLTLNECIADIGDEIKELVEALEQSGGEVDDNVFGEFGDVLLSAVSVGNVLGIDSESALRSKAIYFRDRYLRFEALIKERKMSELNEGVARQLWKQAK
jgi:tetrapyrrole methylase family protein/MazG family protein